MNNTDRFWTWTRWWSSADSPALRSPACKGSAGTCGVSSCRCQAPRSWGSPEHRWSWSPTRTLCDWAFCADPHTGTLDRCCSSPQVWMVYWLWHNCTPEGLQSGVESSDAHLEETSCREKSVMNSWFVMFFIIYCCSWSSLDKRSSSHTVESWSSSVSLTRFAPFINYLLFYSSWIFSLKNTHFLSIASRWFDPLTSEQRQSEVCLHQFIQTVEEESITWPWSCWETLPLFYSNISLKSISYTINRF